MSRTKNSLRNIFYGVILKIVTMLTPFVIRTAIIYCIGIEYVGLNSLFNSILNFLSLSELGFASAVVYMLYKPVAENDEEMIKGILTYLKRVYRVVGTIILVVGSCLLPFVGNFINGEYPADMNIYVLYAVYLFNTAISYFLFSYRGVVFSAYQRIDITNKMSTVINIISSIVQITIILCTKNYYLYVLCSPLFTIIQNLLIGFIAKKNYKKLFEDRDIDNDTRKTLNKKVMSLMGHKIGGTIAGSLDNIVISAFLGLTILAQYTNYYVIITMLMGILSIISQSVLPSVGNYLIKSSNIEKMNLFYRLNFAFVWFVGWASVCLLCLYQPFVTLWLGEEFLLPMHTVVLLAIYFYAWQFRVMGCNFKDAGGLWNEDWLKPYVSSLVNVILNVILIQIIGLDGVLISTIISMILVFFPWETYILYKKMFCLPAKDYLLRNVIYVVVWSGIAVATYGVCYIICVDNAVLELMLKAIVCCIVPNIFYIVVFHKTFEFKYYLDLAKNACDKIARKGR